MNITWLLHSRLDVCLSASSSPLPHSLSLHFEKRTSSQREMSAQSRYAITFTLLKTFYINFRALIWILERVWYSKQTYSTFLLVELNLKECLSEEEKKSCRLMSGIATSRIWLHLKENLMPKINQRKMTLFRHHNVQWQKNYNCGRL